MTSHAPIIRPKKHLGQNFMVDHHVRDKIIEACALKDSETILEIGPGQGFLTERILPKVKQVIAVEKDPTLVALLKDKFKGSSLEVIHADILQFDFTRLKPPVKIIGNLPYNIASLIIIKALEHKDLFQSFFMTIQLEHGLRMIAKPSTKDYGSFSCLVQYHAAVKKLFNIKPTAFRPIPKVQSCFLHLSIPLEKSFQTKDEKAFFQFVKTAFSQRRKTLQNALQNHTAKHHITDALTKLGLSPNIRAEKLTLPQFIELFEFLEKK